MDYDYPYLISQKTAIFRFGPLPDPDHTKYGSLVMLSNNQTYSKLSNADSRESSSKLLARKRGHGSMTFSPGLQKNSSKDRAAFP